MKLLSLDPSSTRIGYALFEGEQLAEFGFITPASSHGEANVRIREMLVELSAMMDADRPDEVVIEDTSGRMFAGRRGGGAGMGTYGKAVGAVWTLVVHVYHLPATLITAEVWTQGRPKAERQIEIARAHPEYAGQLDVGADAADAIGLGFYWLGRRKARELCART